MFKLICVSSQRVAPFIEAYPQRLMDSSLPKHFGHLMANRDQYRHVLALCLPMIIQATNSIIIKDPAKIKDLMNADEEEKGDEEKISFIAALSEGIKQIDSDFCEVYNPLIMMLCLLA